jgi:hypothetical protein
LGEFWRLMAAQDNEVTIAIIGFVGGLLGGVLGGAVTVRGAERLRRRSLTTEHRLRMYNQLIPEMLEELSHNSIYLAPTFEEKLSEVWRLATLVGKEEDALAIEAHSRLNARTAYVNKQFIGGEWQGDPDELASYTGAIRVRLNRLHTRSEPHCGDGRSTLEEGGLDA